MLTLHSPYRLMKIKDVLFFSIQVHRPLHSILSLGLADGHEVKELNCKHVAQAWLYKGSFGLAASSYASLCPASRHNSTRGSTCMPLKVLWGSGLSSLEPFGGSGRDVGHARLLEECGRPLELIQKLRAGRGLSPTQICAQAVSAQNKLCPAMH